MGDLRAGLAPSEIGVPFAPSSDSGLGQKRSFGAWAEARTAFGALEERPFGSPESELGVKATRTSEVHTPCSGSGVACLMISGRSIPHPAFGHPLPILGEGTGNVACSPLPILGEGLGVRAI